MILEGSNDAYDQAVVLGTARGHITGDVIRDCLTKTAKPNGWRKDAPGDRAQLQVM